MPRREVSQAFHDLRGPADAPGPRRSRGRSARGRGRDPRIGVARIGEARESAASQGGGRARRAHRGGREAVRMGNRWDVEFSLALHNRTGKYHIGRDILADQADLVGDVRYWRRTAARVPTGLRARVLGRLLQLEIRARLAGSLSDAVPRLRPRRRLLHLDPFTVVLSALEARDMVLCHDLGPVTHPDLFAPSVVALYRRAFEEIARARPRMAFVSRATMEAFAAAYGASGAMEVIHPPIRAALDRATPSPVAGVAAPFLLTVGSLGRRKNQALAIRAFARSGLAERGMGYVLCGAAEPGAEEVRRAAAAVPGVRLLPYVSDAELVWLYDHAAGFVLASRLEGFGMPVAEAIGRGLVPLVSAGSVLEEVAGPGALAADPLDEAAVAAGMARLCAMGAEERAARRRLLAGAIGRFTREAFAARWREALTARG